MKLLVDRCSNCGAPIYWNDEIDRSERTCSCETNEVMCDGGCCGATCGTGCESDEPKEKEWDH